MQGVTYGLERHLVTLVRVFATGQRALLLPPSVWKTSPGCWKETVRNCEGDQRQLLCTASSHPCPFPNLDSQGHVHLPSTCPNLFSVCLMKGSEFMLQDSQWRVYFKIWRAPCSSVWGPAAETLTRQTPLGSGVFGNQAKTVPRSAPGAAEWGCWREGRRQTSSLRGESRVMAFIAHP